MLNPERASGAGNPIIGVNRDSVWGSQMKRPIVIAFCVGIAVSIVAILLNLVTNDRGWIFGDVIIGFIFLLASGVSLGGNVGDGGKSIFTRRIFQEMYQEQPRKIRELNNKATTASMYCLCIGLPNFLLAIAAGVLHHYY